MSLAANLQDGLRNVKRLAEKDAEVFVEAVIEHTLHRLYRGRRGIREVITVVDIGEHVARRRRVGCSAAILQPKPRARRRRCVLRAADGWRPIVGPQGV